MENKSIHKNPRDPAEERFEWLEAQVTVINGNMNLLMVSLARNIERFGDDRGSNSEIESEGKLRYQEYSRKESRKEYEK